MSGEERTPELAYTALLAHELRTPVTAIFGYLQLLDLDELFNDPVRLRQYLSVVRGRAADLARIVAELTTFSDLLASGVAPADGATPVGLPALVTRLAAKRPVRLEATAEAGSAAIDSERVQLVLGELLENAFKFGMAGAEVLVRATVTADPARLVIQVSNQGAAIPDALREAIFDPFRQVEMDNARSHGGLGLGLAVARRAAEGIGGTLDLESGAPPTFRLVIPLREDPIARQARALREQAAQADAQALRAIGDVRALREATARERAARELAEAQQLLAVGDFRAAHREALALADRLDRGYLETISALAKAVEARDDYTGGHIERVRQHSLRIARGRGLTDDTLRQLEFGAVLHDVGKIAVPDAILGKRATLDSEEWVFMRRHPEIGRRVLEGISFLTDALDAVACHHERWDGGGYPGGLAGEAIPLFGRIVAVADAYDAMTTDRPYRLGMPPEVALAEIEHGRGAQFDPDLAAAFLLDPPRAAAR
jgi:HD-GYP domain-containing protein (c-di-GMP phosphodiesterase class II)/anti-sigma regulatory factor (Ser/Thr protein kinase)